MPNNKLYSSALVAAQIILIVLICTRALPAKPGAALIPALILLTVAGVLAVAAVITLKLSNLSVMPEPVSHGELITNGPYKLIRHPMYTSVLLGCTAMLLLNITVLNGALVVALFVVLTFKIRREESLLQTKYVGYSEYSKHTGALLPKLSRKQ